MQRLGAERLTWNIGIVAIACEMGITTLHPSDHHLRSRKGHPEHKELVIDIYACVEWLAIEYTLRRHKVVVRLKERVLMVILDWRLDTYGGEKEIIIRCRRIVH